jgi:hypothetical protein
METRFRVLGFGTERVEDSDKAVAFYWSGPDPEAFSSRYGSWGATVPHFQAVMTAAVKQIAAEGKLVWEQHAEGNRMLARLTAKS